MKQLLALNLVLLMFAISLADDCGADTFSKAIQLYKHFDALHMRACHHLNINIDAYLLMRKKCVKQLVENYDYEDLGDLTTEFWQSGCFSSYSHDVCDDINYINFKHCAFDFGLEHLDEFLELYKKNEVMERIFNYTMEAKECLTRGLDEIETQHKMDGMAIPI